MNDLARGELRAIVAAVEFSRRYITDRAIELIAEKGYDPQFGARPVKRIIQREILNELSKMILTGQVEKDNQILVDATEDKLLFRNQA